MAEKENRVTYEVESRLDELFTEEENIMGDSADESDSSSQNKLRDLEAVILSIDWEINDDILTCLLDQINALKEEYKNDRLKLLFLQLLETLGKYIKINKVNAHPNSIKLLTSVFQSFEKVVDDSTMPNSKQKEILQTEVKRFKELKEQISNKRTQYEASEKRKMPPKQKKSELNHKLEAELESVEPLEHTAFADKNFRESEEFVAVLEEIKTVIQTEFKALRTELRQWRKEN